MCSKLQIHHKSASRPNFDIIPPPFDMKKHAQPKRHPQNCLKTPNVNAQISKQ